jgi:catechol 2,3-dioxygenase-like lactoylglutathione lyase family enzyme
MVLKNSLLKGVEGVFIPVKNPAVSAEWYERVLGFSLVYLEEEAAVMEFSSPCETVVCLVKTPNHQPMSFPKNSFGVGKYFNFIPTNLDVVYQVLKEKNVKVGAIGGEGRTRFFTFYDPDGNPLGVCQ